MSISLLGSLLMAMKVELGKNSRQRDIAFDFGRCSFRVSDKMCFANSMRYVCCQWFLGLNF